jgi:hypothetical protein
MRKSPENIAKPNLKWTNADWAEYMKLAPTQRAEMSPTSPPASSGVSYGLILLDGIFCQTVSVGLALTLYPTWPHLAVLISLFLWLVIHWKIPTNRLEARTMVAFAGMEFIVFALLYIAWSRLGLHWLFGIIAIYWGVSNIRDRFLDYPVVFLGLTTLYYGNFWGGCLLLCLSAIPNWRWGKKEPICWTRLPA